MEQLIFNCINLGE